MSSLHSNGGSADAKVVVVRGVPSTMNPQKMKLDFMKQSSVKIKGIKARNGEAEISFQSVDDARMFRNNHPKTLQFGGKEHPITVDQYAPEIDLAEDALTLSPPEFEESFDESVIKCDKVYGWSELRKLPPVRRGVLVQNLPADITPLRLKNYFENEESHGGKVSQVCFLVDGILILFKDERIAEEVWEFRPHRIDGKPVTIIPKMVPEYYKDRFSFESMDEAFDEAAAAKYLHEKFSTYPIQSIMRTPTQIFLVTFTKKLDRDELQKIIQQFQTDNDHKVRAKLLPKTDCLRVEGVKNLSDAEITTLFENRKRAHGGQVTRIDHVKGNAVLLYFSSYEDAERVCAEFHREKLCIFNSELKIFRYYHSCFESHFKVSNDNPLDDLVGKEGWPQVSFLYKISQAMVGFLKEKIEHFNQLEKDLSKIATAAFMEEGLKIFPNSDVDANKISSSEIMIVHKCQRIIDRFLQEFEERELDELTENVGKNGSIFIWNCGRGTRKSVICGPKREVQIYIQKRSQIQDHMLLEPNQYRWLLECKILEKQKQQHSNCRINEGTRTLHVKAKNKQEVVYHLQHFDALLKDLEHEQFCHEEKLIMKFLSKVEYQSEIQKRIHEALGSRKNVIFGVNGGLPFLYGEKDHIVETKVALKNFMSVEFGEISPSSLSGISCLKKLEDKHMLLIDIKGTSVKLAGFYETVKKTITEIDRDFAGKVKWIKIFKTDPGKAEFLARFDQDFQKLCRSCVIGYDGSKYHEGKIILKGPHSFDEVLNHLKMAATKISEKTEEVKMPGIAQFLCTEEGKNILATAGSDFNTVITLRSVDCDKTVNAQERSEQQCSFMIEDLTVTIQEGDIINAKSDAIVNSVHPSYDLTKGSLSRAILLKAGYGIQSDVYGKPGISFRSTSGGHLHFKRIFHMIVENFSANLVDVLEEANRFKLASVSIPAIGTGRAQKSVQEAIESMKSAFHNFVKKCPSPHHLKDVAILIQDPAVLKQFLAASWNMQEDKVNSKSGTAILGEGINHASRSASVSNTGDLFPIIFGPLKVSVYEGNILREATDAIVNSIGPSFILEEGMVSKQILAEEGVSMQNELDAGNDDNIRVTKATKLKCKNVIHIVTGQGMDLTERVVKILETAEERQFASLSLPAIGSGRLGLSTNKVAKLIRDGFIKFVENTFGKSKYPKIVNIVIFGSPQAFIDGFFDAKHDSPRKSTLAGSSLSHAVKISTLDTDSASLLFYSQSKDLGGKASKKVRDLLCDAYVTEELRDDTMRFYEEDFLQVVTKVCSDKHISVEKSESCGSAVVLKGPKSFVAEAKISVVGIIKDQAGILSDSEDYIWKYKDASDGWKGVEPEVNLILEKIQQRSLTSITSIYTCGKSYELDMTAKKLDNGPLQRSTKGDDGTDGVA